MINKPAINIQEIANYAADEIEAEVYYRAGWADTEERFRDFVAGLLTNLLNKVGEE